MPRQGALTITGGSAHSVAVVALFHKHVAKSGVATTRADAATAAKATFPSEPFAFAPEIPTAEWRGALELTGSGRCRHRNPTAISVN
jgi:hypothetical protein